VESPPSRQGMTFMSKDPRFRHYDLRRKPGARPSFVGPWFHSYFADSLCWYDHFCREIITANGQNKRSVSIETALNGSKIGYKISC